MTPLMPDSRPIHAERAVQPSFRKMMPVQVVILWAAVLAFHSWAGGLPNRIELGVRNSPIAFTPVRLDPKDFGPLRLVGAWQVASADPRFGGLSALVTDGDQLIALSDSGVLVRFGKPGSDGALAQIWELPDGPGDPRFKSNRDSEALVRDPLGRGWWVAFENRNEIWLYDLPFERALARVPLRQKGLGVNTGVEGMSAAPRGLWLFQETGRLLRLRLAADAIDRIRLDDAYGRLSDAAVLPDGRTLVLARNITLSGFRSQLLELVRERSSGELELRPFAPLGVGPFDNMEGLAIERRAGGSRLWLVTDDNKQRPMRTLLVALDLPERP